MTIERFCRIDPPHGNGLRRTGTAMSTSSLVSRIAHANSGSAEARSSSDTPPPGKTFIPGAKDIVMLRSRRRTNAPRRNTTVAAGRATGGVHRPSLA